MEEMCPGHMTHMPVHGRDGSDMAMCTDMAQTCKCAQHMSHVCVCTANMTHMHIYGGPTGKCTGIHTQVHWRVTDMLGWESQLICMHRFSSYVTEMHALLTHVTGTHYVWNI